MSDLDFQRIKDLYGLTISKSRDIITKNGVAGEGCLKEKGFKIAED